MSACRGDDQALAARSCRRAKSRKRPRADQHGASCAAPRQPADKGATPLLTTPHPAGRGAPPAQLFYSFFKTLIGKDVVVELKNGTAQRKRLACARDPRRPLPSSQRSHTARRCPAPRADLAIRGTLHSVDQYLNIKLLDVTVVEPDKFPHMVRERRGRRPPTGVSARETRLASGCRLAHSSRSSGATRHSHGLTPPLSRAPATPRAAIGEALLCPRLGHQIRAAAQGGCRRRAAAGRDSEGVAAAKISQVSGEWPIGHDPARTVCSPINV